MSSSVSKTTVPLVRNRKKELHYVFGYGSLLCPESRAITAPTLSNKRAQPILARHVERTWTARGYNMTYVGAQFKTDAQCTGVLLPVTAKELAQFDVREGGYDRVSLSLDQLERIPFLSEEHHDENHAVFTTPQQVNEVRVWMYVPRNPVPADSNAPIAQSYVDIILRGCLSISQEFATSFLETTAGWWHEGETGSWKRLGTSQQHYTWIDDRHSPQYVRADYHYSNKMANHFDSLLRQHQHQALSKRQALVSA